MRICIISGIFHPEIGGPATHLYHICFELAKKGNKLYVITYGDIKESHNYPFFIKRISRRQPLLLKLLKFAYQVIKIGKDCDVFYVDNYGFPVIVANLILRKPMVMRIVGDFAWEYAYRRKLTLQNIGEFQGKRQPLFVELIRRAQCFYAKMADSVIVPSNYLKSMVERWGIPPHKIGVVRNAVKKENFNIALSQIEAKKTIGINSKIILTAGRLMPWKGIDMLITILPRLNGEIRLLIIGDGVDMTRLKALAYAFGVENRVVFTGEIPHNKLGLYFKAADVFALPSLYEGLPHVLLEAMAAGIPIAAANTGGIPELIEDGRGGLLFKSQDLSDLEESINRILEDGEVSRGLVENSKEKARQFDFRLLEEKITATLNSAVHGAIACRHKGWL